MSTENYSKEVFKIAEKYHRGILRKDGKPYISHLVAVAEIAVVDFNWGCRYHLIVNRESIKSIAYLHDVLEDTTLTVDNLRNLLTNIIENPKVAEFIIEKVVLLTKRKENFDLMEYLTKIKADYIARHIKFADLTHNRSDLMIGPYKNQKQLDIYRLTKFFLEN